MNMSKLNIYIAGHKGMVGSAILKNLKKNKKVKIITRNKKDLDLTNQNKVNKFFRLNKIDQVYLAAAKVGGIYANDKYPAEFIYENLIIQSNVIHAAFKTGVKKLLFLGSSCIYPKNIRQPMKEKQLLDGPLEKTNEPYAIAKIAGIKLCESYNRQYGDSHKIDYRCIMPTNLYGPGDRYDNKNSHVIPALINRFHISKLNNKPFVEIWGSGKPKREFLFVEDLAKACIHLMSLDKKFFKKNLRCSHINVGSGKEITIRELAEQIKDIVGYKGKIKFNRNKPDGVSRKIIDSTKLNELGWNVKITLKNGLKMTYQDFLNRCC